MIDYVKMYREWIDGGFDKDTALAQVASYIALVGTLEDLQMVVKEHKSHSKDILDSMIADTEKTRRKATAQTVTKESNDTL